MPAQKENEVILFIGCVLAVKGIRKKSNIAFIDDLLMFGRVANVVLLVMLSTALAVAYTLFLLGLFVVVPFPPYVGNSNYKYLSMPALKAALQETQKDTESKTSVETVWVVLFFATWSSLCVEAAEGFSDLSYYYSGATKQADVKFGKVDVGRQPVAAKKFNIDTSASSKNLPTIVVFREGKEAFRIPEPGNPPYTCDHPDELAVTLGLNDIRGASSGGKTDAQKKEE
ncbi:hypothetical protein SARC_13050 [Sphaeroforma arctica JP610]|uniref:Thioredoxin domain-containing protein n=1 Tax=Sphaeroforma arctica JP610 TaxID=667725 RepID=A0A0L0FD44_9EUKA|nr:hypothetical protein SARC_13050 [Sphaeroforma arctica JP610]KNC74401.1 hypothetical protein SARC_13050 [Sphaeroforma arctica JP610]|eukprot:XP_014148303.1 hypothetical protein SARC_13050 [Sphaeroforma arctica JP610]